MLHDGFWQLSATEQRCNDDGLFLYIYNDCIDIYCVVFLGKTVLALELQQVAGAIYPPQLQLPSRYARLHWRFKTNSKSDSVEATA